MTWLYAFKTFVVIWWIVLFVVLPFGQRTSEADPSHAQAEDGPAEGITGRSVFNKLAITTGLSIVVFAIFYVVTIVYGIGMDDFPQVLPPLE